MRDGAFLVLIVVLRLASMAWHGMVERYVHLHWTAWRANSVLVWISEALMGTW